MTPAYDRMTLAQLAVSIRTLTDRIAVADRNDYRACRDLEMERQIALRHYRRLGGSESEIAKGTDGT